MQNSDTISIFTPTGERYTELVFTYIQPENTWKSVLFRYP